MLGAVVLTQYRRVTDGRTDRQTDGIAVASSALAMRALRRVVKTYKTLYTAAATIAWCKHAVIIRNHLSC